MDELKKKLEKHIAGAIVSHHTPFDHLPSHRNVKDLDQDFINKWVIPYYMSIAKYGNEWIGPVKAIKPEITKDITLMLLGDFNWRTRLVGSYFSAIGGFDDHIDIIGTHLIKSETCCTGYMYSLVLSFFNTEASNQYIDTYLNYYLTKSKLYFDQVEVMTASLYLDKVNGTHRSEKHRENWDLLMKSWNTETRELKISHLEEQVELLKTLSDYY